MYYASTTTIRGFWVYNSREGVTPFCIREEGEEFRHIDWAWDRHEPTCPPVPGLRFFRTRTQEEAEHDALAQLERFVRGGELIERDSLAWIAALSDLTDAFLQAPKLDRRPGVPGISYPASAHRQAA